MTFSSAAATAITKSRKRVTVIHQGTYVAADNSLFAQINDYRETIQQLDLLGIVHTWCESHLV
jgi:hypothetical protein